MEEIEYSIKIAEAKYLPVAHNIVFIFDQSSGHRAFAEDALNARKMNVEDGGKQPFQRDTLWNGQPQRMVTASGKQKGLRTVLQERSVDTSGMLKADMVKKLEAMHDFQHQRSKVEELVNSKGHRAIFLPKFHCELNPIGSS